MSGRVLITGATGFIGSHVTRLFVAGGWDVQVHVRPDGNTSRIADVIDSVDVVRGDLSDATTEVDLCVHLAWYAVPGLYLTSPENLVIADASLGLARRLAENGCGRFIGVGTCLEYGISDRPLGESSPVRPVSPYASAKHSLQQALRDLPMDLTWMRIFYPYGPAEDERRLVPTVIRSLMENRPAELTHGQQIRDYIHVEDVASAFLHAAEQGLNGCVNVGSGREVTVRQVAATIGSLLGRSELLKFGARRAGSQAAAIVADVDRLTTSGWSPKYGLKDGLDATIEWWGAMAR